MRRDVHDALARLQKRENIVQQVCTVFAASNDVRFRCLRCFLGKCLWIASGQYGNGVGILPLMEDGTVLVVRQFRYPGDSVLTEIPAGKLEYGEDPLDCGKRELSEEVGAEAREWIFLGNIYPTPAYDSEVIRIYLAIGLTFGRQHLDEGEFLNVCRVPLRELADKVMAGEIRDAKTQIAVLKTMYMLEHGQLKPDGAE